MAKITARFLTPTGRAWKGKVTFSPGADIVLGARGDRVNILVGDFEAVLDDSGYFAVELPPGMYTVRFGINNPETGQVAKIRDVVVTVEGNSTLADLIEPPAPVAAGTIRVNERDLERGVIV